MSSAQWLFHYLEIKKYNNEDKSVLLQSLADIDSSIQAFYLLIDRDRGVSMMDALSEIRSKRNDDTDDDNTNYTKLTDTDEELLAFADTLPMQLEVPEELKNTGKFILPTKRLSDIIGENAIYEEVDSLDDIDNSQYGDLGDIDLG